MAKAKKMRKGGDFHDYGKIRRAKEESVARKKEKIMDKSDKDVDIRHIVNAIEFYDQAKKNYARGEYESDKKFSPVSSDPELLKKSFDKAGKQVPPVKQQGGYLQGKSHKDGGMPAIVGGNTPVELEGGEYIIRKSSVDKLGKGVLEEINKEGRIPTMAKGGKTKKTPEWMEKHGDKKVYKGPTKAWQAKYSDKKVFNAKDIKTIREIMLKQAGLPADKKKADGGDIEEYGAGDYVRGGGHSGGRKLTIEERVAKLRQKHGDDSVIIDDLPISKEVKDKYKNLNPKKEVKKVKVKKSKVTSTGDAQKFFGVDEKVKVVKKKHADSGKHSDSDSFYTVGSSEYKKKKAKEKAKILKDNKLEDSYSDMEAYEKTLEFQKNKKNFKKKYIKGQGSLGTKSEVWEAETDKRAENKAKREQKNKVTVDDLPLLDAEKKRLKAGSANARRKASYDAKGWRYDDTIDGYNRDGTKIANKTTKKVFSPVKGKRTTEGYKVPEEPLVLAPDKEDTEVKTKSTFKSKLGSSKTDALRRKQTKLTGGLKKTKAGKYLESSKKAGTFTTKQTKAREELAEKTEAEKTRRMKRAKRSKSLFGRGINKMKDLLNRRGKEKRVEGNSGVGLKFEQGGYMPSAPIPAAPPFRQGMRMMGHGGVASVSNDKAGAGDVHTTHSHSGYKAGE